MGIFRLKKALACALSLLLCLAFVPVAYGDVSDDVDGVETGEARQSLELPEGTGRDSSAAKSEASAEADSASATVRADDGADESAGANQGAEEAASSALEADEGQAVASTLADGTYLIRSLVSDSKVLDVEGGSVADSANVRIHDSNMTNAQRFRVEFQDGYCTITNVNSGKVLDVVGGNAVDGTNVQQYAPNGSDAQKWKVVQNADGTYTIESKLKAGLVLDVDGGIAENGRNVLVYGSNGSAAQKFEFVDTDVTVPASDQVEQGAYFLACGAGESYVADIPGASVDNGVQAQLYSLNQTGAQMFMVVVGADGYAVLRSVNSGKVLDVDSGNLVSGTKVQQWTDEGNRNQKWSLRSNGDGTYALYSAANGLVLDAQGGLMENGTPLQTYRANGTSAQKWRLLPVERALTDGLYTFVSMLDAGKVLDVKDAATQEGTRVQVWSNNASPAQKFQVAWTAVEVEGSDGALEKAEGITLRPMTGAGQYVTGWDDGTVSLVQAQDDFSRQVWIPSISENGGIVLQNAKTGKVLDVSGAGTYDGCPVGTYDANGTAAQAFRALGANALDNGVYTIQSTADGRVLDVDGGSRSNGANVQAWTQNGTGAQAWTVESMGDGYFRITNARSKKCLDVSQGLWASGANVQQWSSDDVDAQRWRVVATADGCYQFVSACGGYVLDIAGGGGYDGANAQIYESNQTPAQKFRLVPTTYVPEDFEDLLSSFTTYSTNTWAGTYNMQRALNCFNGVVIQPGQTLSFFAITGPCGAAEGYLPAGVVGGVGYGGGICQASTTIYGAAIRAGFGIVDRQNHSVPSTYVPIGLDAMVNWGTSDLVVRNDTGYPVKIVTRTYDNVLTCEFWGIQPDWYDWIDAVSWYTGSSSAAAQRVYYKDGMSVRTEALPSSYYW